MARIETWYKQDMNTPVVIHFLQGSIFTLDEYGNVFGVELYKDGEPYSGGGTVSANVIRANGTTVAVTGSISGNRASAVMPQAAYAVTGTATVVLKLTQGGDTVTIGCFIVPVSNSEVGDVVDPGTIMPSISMLLTNIQEAVESIPLDYSELNDYVNWYTQDFERCNSWVSGYYKINSSSVTHMSREDITSNDNYVCQAIPCEEGDVFEYTGGVASPLYCIAFISDAATNNIIEKAAMSGSQKTRQRATAPANSKYLLVNSRVASYETLVVRFAKQRRLHSGDDLDLILSDGVYYCYTSAIASNIDHKPSAVTVGFRLDVQSYRFNTSSDIRVRQIITTNTTSAGSFGVYIRNKTDSGFSEWFEVYHGNQNFLDVQNLKAIESGTDLDDVIEFGSYYCPNATVAVTLDNLPFVFESGFGLYVLNTGNPSTENSYIRQFIFANKKAQSTIYTRQLNATWGEWQLLIGSGMYYSPTILADSNFSVPQRLSGTPKKTIRVATNNIAHYRWQGKADAPYLADIPLGVSKWRRWLLNNNIDILFLQECEDYIDDDYTISAFDTLYKPFFDSDTNVDSNPGSSGTADVSRRKILNRLGLNTNSTVDMIVTESGTKHGYGNWCIVNLSGVGNILMINIHNMSGTDYAEGRAAFLQDLATFMSSKSFDYFIIAGDTNIRDDERSTLLSFCSSISGIPANGGMIGWFGTRALEEIPKSYDNIIVSNNIRFERIECDSGLISSDELYTDHTPVIAEISFM